MHKLIRFFVLLASYGIVVGSFSADDPIWQTSEDFRAGNQKVISTLTGNSETPTHTFTFTKAFTNAPNLAYGIKNYEGDDYMGI